MNYIGSKYSLLPEIEAMLDDHGVPHDGIALDLFAGTGAVAQLLKRRGYVVYANDWQRYAYLTNVAFIEHNAFPTFGALVAKITDVATTDNIAAFSACNHSTAHNHSAWIDDIPCVRVLSVLNHLPGRQGAFYEAYCEGGQAGRTYYARENGLRIQAIRDQIEEWHRANLLSDQEKAWLVACLIESADRVANTASVYGAYLKHIKKTAHKPLALVALQPVPSPHPAGQHRAFCEDGVALLDRLFSHSLPATGVTAALPVTLIYIDPPYNHRQYAANYHILETIAHWDMGRFEPRGVTGLRPSSELRSDLCIRSAVEAAFKRLFEKISSDYLLFSYNNEGLLAEEKLLKLFEEFCTDVDFRRIYFKRFRADVDHANRIYKADHTHEFLVFGRPRRSTAR